MSNGSFALLFVNVGPKASPPLTCDAACVGKLLKNATAAARYRVRDVWAKRDLPDAQAPLSVSSPTLEAEVGVHMVRLWPLP